MTDYFVANTITTFIPNLTYSLPYFGSVDFTKAVSALVIFIVLTFFFWLVRHVLIERLTVLSKKTSFSSDDVIVDAVRNIHVAVYTVASLYFSLQVFSFSEIVDKVFSGIFYVVLTWQVIRILTGLIKHFSEARLKEDEDGNVDPNAATAADMISLIAKIVLWALGALFVLSNLGIEVTSLIAGLGIGGIAVAFALQGILSDLFASFSLYFDKPFRIGDFIVIGADSGTVEKIGIKSTRIRTLQGEELVVSNAELTTVRVQNFKKMQERRIVSGFGVTYETKPELLEKISGIVEAIFANIDGAHLDRVYFTTFGDSSLQYEVVYFVKSSEYVEFLKIQETYNFALLKKFAELGIEFAYPTQVIYTKAS